MKKIASWGPWVVTYEDSNQLIKQPWLFKLLMNGLKGLTILPIVLIIISASGKTQRYDCEALETSFVRCEQQARHLFGLLPSLSKPTSINITALTRNSMEFGCSYSITTAQGSAQLFEQSSGHFREANCPGSGKLRQLLQQGDRQKASIQVSTAYIPMDMPELLILYGAWLFLLFTVTMTLVVLQFGED